MCGFTLLQNSIIPSSVGILSIPLCGFGAGISAIPPPSHGMTFNSIAWIHRAQGPLSATEEYTRSFNSIAWIPILNFITQYHQNTKLLSIPLRGFHLRPDQRTRGCRPFNSIAWIHRQQPSRTCMSMLRLSIPLRGFYVRAQLEPAGLTLSIPLRGFPPR